MGWLQADIVTRPASREEFATLAGEWLTATREERPTTAEFSPYPARGGPTERRSAARSSVASGS